VPEPRRSTGRVAAVVLAAGAATRFGSTKALAPLDGRPVLQHVLDALAVAAVGEVLVVLGDAATEIEGGIDWRNERRVRNPHPQRGLASSLQVGLDALDDEVAGALIALGDQPRLRPAVVRQIVGAWRTGTFPIVVPHYAASGTLNPVLLDRGVWPLAMALEGDRGMGPFIHAEPARLLIVPVEGDNPDVDTPADLERLAGR
jgi:molybdenum cofactor cytidylyltransferase